MKTTDLIPIILYQLVDGDKYGYEIVKQIEDSSNGGIIIKQPTLYSVLKKLEQGRFISSYWQDSEIGGKRHYYKLTENGKAQLDTYPPFETLLKDALDSEGITIAPSLSFSSQNVETNINDTNPETDFEEQDVEDIKPAPIDLTVSLNPVVNDNLDNLKEDDVLSTCAMSNEDDKPSTSDIDYDIHEDTAYDTSSPTIEIEEPNPNNIFETGAETSSTPILNIFDAIDYENSSFSQKQHTDSVQQESIKDEQIETNIIQDISIENDEIMHSSDLSPKFTEKVEPIVDNTADNKLYDNLTPNSTLIQEVENASNLDISPIAPIEEVKFLNYVDFSTDKNIIKRKKAVAKHIQKMSFTCITLLLILVLSIVVCSKYSFSKLYYICAIVACLVIILYPILLLINTPKIRFKYCLRPFKYSLSRDFFIKLSMFLSVIITVFAYNLTIVTNVKDIFDISNFANFLAPILLAMVIILDFIYNAIIYKQYTTKK